MSIERSKTVAEQVSALLRDRIRSQTYAAGVRLPSESELANEFQVSRATIRTALAQLAMEGLILRKQGDGTYVNERLPQVNTHLGGLWEFNHLIASSGYQPTIRLLATQTRAATAQESDVLDIAVEDTVVSMERIFFANNRPVILAQNILPVALVKQPHGKIDGKLPIRDFVKTYCQREIAYAISDIRATLAASDVADTLEREANSPLLKLKMTFYDKNNAPLLFGASYFDDTVLNLRLVQAWG